MAYVRKQKQAKEGENLNSFTSLTLVIDYNDSAHSTELLTPSCPLLQPSRSQGFQRSVFGTIQY